MRQFRDYALLAGAIASAPMTGLAQQSPLEDLGPKYTFVASASHGLKLPGYTLLVHEAVSSEPGTTFRHGKFTKHPEAGFLGGSADLKRRGLSAELALGILAGLYAGTMTMDSMSGGSGQIEVIALGSLSNTVNAEIKFTRNGNRYIVTGTYDRTQNPKALTDALTDAANGKPAAGNGQVELTPGEIRSALEEKLDETIGELPQ
jgi:hypothetical protein